LKKEQKFFLLKTKTNFPVNRTLLPFQHSLKAEKQNERREEIWLGKYLLYNRAKPKILSRFAFTAAAALQLPKIAVVIIARGERGTTLSQNSIFRP